MEILQVGVEDRLARSSSDAVTSFASAAPSGEMTPDIVPDMGELDSRWIVLVVRNMSSAVVGVSKDEFFLSTSSTVANFFSEVGKTLRYEPNSFALTYQRSNGEQVELNELPPEKCLGELGFTVGSSHWNNLILTDLHGMQPRRMEEDDLSLGASASPTSLKTEEYEFFKSSPFRHSFKFTPDTASNTGPVKSDIVEVGYVGLVNQAMTCYLNSLLQTLFMTPEFRNALYRWEFKDSEEAAAKSIPYQLQKLFLQLQTATRSAVETTSLTKSFGWDSSEVWQQHDIQELYRVMFDALEQCFKNTDQAEFISNLYEGKMKDYVKCLECGTENAREDSFLDIPLPIRPFGSNTAYKCVEEALRAFVEPELLTGNNKYECAKCNTHCDAHKGLKFTRFPYLLTLHLKRFDFDYQTFHRIKLNDKVTFPTILDLNGFIEDSCGKESSQQQQQQQQTTAGQTNSPDKCSADKLDDASTTDSALDAEESSSVGFSASNQMSNDTDTQRENSFSSKRQFDIKKNHLLCISSNGPYVYELFSIMVHSGSASGGHYYAYIKDFKTGEWFCFNDQSVYKITSDDIRKTYGGSNARGCYSSWSSSANAYMLMYRQTDKERNADFFSEEQFPPHIKDLVQKMVTEEAAEREECEIERPTCKIKNSSQHPKTKDPEEPKVPKDTSLSETSILAYLDLAKKMATEEMAECEAQEMEENMCEIQLFCQHPQWKFLTEKKLKIHKETTLGEITKLAYRELMLEDVVPFERCRLVKYEEVHDSIECFENQDNDPISEVLVGVRSTYKFDLFMEIRDEEKQFEVYKPGEITVKVFIINPGTEEVEGPQTIRAAQNPGEREFKEQLGRIVQARYCEDLRPLPSNSKAFKKRRFLNCSELTRGIGWSGVMCLKDKKPQQGGVEDRTARTSSETASAAAAAVVAAATSTGSASSDSTAASTSSDSSASAAPSGGDSELKVMTPDIVPDMGDLDSKWIVLIVRDMSSAVVGISKDKFFLSTCSTVANFFSEVGKTLRYEPNSFALTYQRSNGDQVELNELPPEKCLGDLGFTVGSSHWNNLILTDLHGMQPRRVEEDDLSLGASASPTSLRNEDSGFVKSSPFSKQSFRSAPDIAWPSSHNFKAAPDTASNTARIKPDTAGYVGLVNQAMTCYLNSLLQTLFMTPEFRNALYRWEFKDSEEAATKSIPYQLQKLFLQLQTATRSAVETTNLTKSFGWDSSEVWQQHDIQELYRVMFDALEQCFKNTDQAEFINNLYEGKMKDYVKCLECGTENAREDSFLDIPLPIRPFGSNTAYKCVEEALRAFVEPELLTGNNKYECTKCSAHCDAHKGLKFTRFPYLLTLHLKRFDFDYQTFHRIKLNDKVTFPNILDLNGFIEDSCGKESLPQQQQQQQQQQQTTAGQTNSPDKCSADKLDDASTTDSALDAEESSSVGFSASNQMSNDTDTQDEDEGIDVSSVYNEKNRLLCSSSNGPYVYELFSIMVHSGSASGGHYYAYIKEFKTGEWFCFNDQSVSRITSDDIRKTYGGSNARGCYSSWSSSANAYMLMYRQTDKERNADFFSEEQFPPHIKELVKKMVTEEAAEREAREIERHMCKIKLFCQHPRTRLLTEKKLKVHKETTLGETTKLAYQELMLEDVVPFERCRLVKYEEVHDSIECSFENQDDEPISEVLGGVRSTYKFDLFMEIRDEDKQFEVYKPGGITVKVFLINLATEEVEGPQTVRAAQNLTVREFKELLGRTFAMDADKMRIVQERYCNDHKPLLSDTKTLKEEGFYRSTKVYIEASGEEAPNFFAGSQLYCILDRYEHTITLCCNLPERSPEVLKELQIPPYNPKEKEQSEANSSPCPNAEVTVEVTTTKESAQSSSSSARPEEATPPITTSLSTATAVTTSLTGPPVTSSLRILTVPATSELPTSSATSPSTPTTPTTPSTDVPKKKIKIKSPAKSKGVSPAPSPQTPTAPVSSSSEASGGVSLSDEDEGVGSSSTVNSDQSASEDSSLTSDSDRTLVGEPPEIDMSDNSPDYHNVSSPEDNSKDVDNDDGGWGAPAHCVSDTGWADLDEDDTRNIKRYFRAHLTEPDVLRVSVDKRITIAQMKNELQKYVGVSEEHFKLYKYYIDSSHEFECTRMTETLTSYCDNNVMKIRLGRALLPGEFKGKVFMLDPTNSEDPSKFLIDFVVCKKESVGKVKNAIVKEVNAKCEMNLDPAKLRLRKKSWKNPQAIFLDHQIFDDDIILYANWEYYLQEIDGPEKKTDNPDELSIFLKRWRPSSYSTDRLIEIILSDPTAEALKEKISQVSGIPLENVEFAKGKGTFPCDMSVLDISTELDWSHKSGSLDKRPIYILDDGAVVYYRDSSEALKTLTEGEKNELASEENSRLNKDYQSSSVTASSSPATVSRTREKGLKIYFSQSNNQ